MTAIRSLLILPPIGIARLGGSDTPLESFVWREDPTIHGAGRTVVEPAVSLEVQSDGLVTPYMPGHIRFKDGDLIRPAAPFFEVWAAFDGDVADDETPLTTKRLVDAGGTLEGVTWRVSAGNLKAVRRTGDPANGFHAFASIRGYDHHPRTLLASSPVLPGTEPLVRAERPILLGQVQVMRPFLAEELGVNLDVLRLRFTPGRGEVYGPSRAAVGQAPEFLRDHMIVKLENRILNDKASWISYDANYAKFNNPEPSDTYDGADIADNIAWGVVDDTCDAVIEVEIVIDGVRYIATARVVAGPPDFAPDRRPFVSLADDLADRDRVEPPPANDAMITEAGDLFQRVFETVSLANLDALRIRAIGDNANGGSGRVSGLPRTDDGTMTNTDKPYADDKLLDLLGPSASHSQLPYTEIAKSLHEPLADLENMIDFLRDNPDRARQLIRPPYAAFPELPSVPSTTPSGPRKMRDPRVPRDQLHDMRMPPYMRDSDATALSLTRRQYLALMELIDYLARSKKAPAKAPRAKVAAGALTPLQKRVASTVARLNRPRKPAKD